MIESLWKNNKKGTYYVVTGTRINATNAQNGQLMVDYQTLEDNPEKFCREVSEFKIKFTEVKE